MNRAREIEERMSIIKSYVEDKTYFDSLTVDQLKGLDEERSRLSQELEGITTAAAERRNFLNDIATGVTPSTVICSHKEERRMEFNTDNKTTQEYRSAFIKTLQGSATAEQRALVTLATGAAVIPTEVFNQVIDNIQKRQGVLSRVNILQIPGKLSIPVSQINTPAEWHIEGAEIADSNMPPTNINLSGYELAKLFSMSAATKSMSIQAFEDYLVGELTRCTGDALNAAIFAGTGSGQASGLSSLTYNATNSITTAVKAVSYDNIVAALGLLASNFSQSACFIMSSKTFYTYMATIKDLSNRPLLISDVTSAAPMRILGKEVIIDDFATDNTIYLGDPNYYFLNFSQPISIEVSGHAGFTKGVTMYRSMTVVDGKPLPTGAFVKIAIPQV